jgi:heptosyltransferase-2
MAIKKILAVRNDRFGEFLLNIPAFRALKKSYAGAKLTLLVNPYVQELARCIDFVDEVITWENTRHKFSQIYRFSRELKAKDFDLCVIFNPSKELNIISFLAGIPIRIGYNRKWAFLLTKKRKDKKYLGQRHEIEYNLELLSLIGIQSEDKALSLKIEDGIIEGLFDIEDHGDLLALHPWTSDAVKQWPIENFRKLTQSLIKEFNKKVIIIGGKEELDKSAEYFSDLGTGAINITGKTTLTQLAAVLKECKLLISGDSGPIHLASCLGTPVIAIFRSDIPAKSVKRWGPQGKGHSIIEKPNLCDITVDEVLDKVRRILNK